MAGWQRVSAMAAAKITVKNKARSGAGTETGGRAKSPSKSPTKMTKRTVAAPEKKASRKAGPARSVRRGPASERLRRILDILRDHYGEAHCALNHRSPWELLVATILSAQCTDVRVNLVTPALFAAYATAAAMAAAPIEALEALIRTTGFYHNKAKSIQGAGRVITERFAGKVPESMDDLLTVPGAARKTANVVLGVAFGKAEGVVVDTHVFRIARRLSLARGDSPQKVEQELMQGIPRDRWIQFSHELIHHGRAVCAARKPKCAECPLEALCTARDKTWQS